MAICFPADTQIGANLNQISYVFFRWARWAVRMIFRASPLLNDCEGNQTKSYLYSGHDTNTAARQLPAHLQAVCRREGGAYA